MNSNKYYPEQLRSIWRGFGDLPEHHLFDDIKKERFDISEQIYLSGKFCSSASQPFGKNSKEGGSRKKIVSDAASFFFTIEAIITGNKNDEILLPICTHTIRFEQEVPHLSSDFEIHVHVRLHSTMDEICSYRKPILLKPIKERISSTCKRSLY